LFPFDQHTEEMNYSRTIFVKWYHDFLKKEIIGKEGHVTDKADTAL